MFYVKNETDYHRIDVQLKAPTLQAFTIDIILKRNLHTITGKCKMGCLFLVKIYNISIKLISKLFEF